MREIYVLSCYPSERIGEGRLSERKESGNKRTFHNSASRTSVFEAVVVMMLVGRRLRCRTSRRRREMAPERECHSRQ